MDVRDLDIDLIDRINPFGEAYAIIAKTMSEDSLKHVVAAISAKRTSLTPDDAKDLAVRAFRFKNGRGRLPSLASQDALEKRMAEGAAAFMRYKRKVAMPNLDELAAEEFAEFAEPEKKGRTCRHCPPLRSLRTRTTRGAQQEREIKSQGAFTGQAAPRETGIVEVQQVVG